LYVIGALAARRTYCLLAVAVLIIWNPQSARAEMPPTPIYRFLFDASRPDSQITEDIKIPEFRTYTVGLEFNYTNELDLYRVASLVGDGPGGGPGIPIRVHLRILQNDHNTDAPVFDNTISTSHRYRQGFSQKYAGSFFRQILVINLRPGIYKIEVNTIDATPQFTAITTYLVVDYDPRASRL
jgi:hypothetical protein